MLAVIIKHASSIFPAIPFSGIVLVRAGISCSTASGDPAAEMQCSSVPFQISSSHSDGGGLIRKSEQEKSLDRKPYCQNLQILLSYHFFFSRGVLAQN